MTQLAPLVIINGLSEGLTSLAYTKDVASIGSGPVGFSINVLVNLLSGKIKSWVEEADIYGSQKINLLRSKDWGVGQQITFVTENDGLEIKYSVTRSSKPTQGAMVLAEGPASKTENALPPTDIGNETAISNPDSVIATSNGDVRVKHEDKFLYAQRGQGVVSKFGPLGDGVYEISENGMFIV